jgi:hypothetical protein
MKSNILPVLDGVRNSPDVPLPKTLGSTLSLEVPPTAAPWRMMLRGKNLLTGGNITVHT